MNGIPERKKSSLHWHWLWLFVCALLTVLRMLTISTTVFAQEEERLRVAFCPLEGFFEYDERGNETGYGVNLLNEITKYSGLRFEYIPADTWEETEDMIVNGEADLRMPVTIPNVNSAGIEYSRNPITSSSHVLMCQKSREDLFYEDYEMFAKLKIGISKNMYKNLFSELSVEDYGLTSDQFVFYDKYEDCYAGIKAGEVDAFISNILDMGSDMKLLFRFDSVPNYIAMAANDPYLDSIDSVIDQINTDDPEFLSDLYERWFPDKNDIPLTKEETQYVKNLGRLTFKFYDGKGYLSMREADGSFSGFYSEVAASICERLKTEYKQALITDQITDEIVIYPDCYFDYDWADENELELTLPYFTVRYYEVKKKNSNPDASSCKIAAVENQRITADFIADGYKTGQIQWYSDEAQCIEAINDGKADIAFVSSYCAEYYLSMYRYANLNYSLTSYNHEVSIGIQGDSDGMMLTILNKMLAATSEDSLNHMLTNSTNNHPNQDILREWVVSRPYNAFAIAGILSALLAASVLAVIFVNRTRKQNLKLQKATAAKSDFLSRMSHDIRTPLNVIIGMNKLAQENENPRDTQECLEKIQISSEFLLGLINDVLDMERVENGKMELHLTPYSGEDFRNYIETIILTLCEQKNIKFDYKYDSPENYTVMQDKLKINQIYFNLLSNAVKYTPEGGDIMFYITAELLSEKRLAMHVMIADNGIGMSKEFQEHMFDAFSQENQVMASVSQGTGLGLTIVKRLCDLMGMRIQVESELGKGTVYRLYGEYEIAGEEKQKTEKKSSEIKQGDYADLAGKTILVCEDHMLNQEIIRRLLEKQQMIVDLVEDGKSGVEKFSNSSPGTYDAILMDIRMPIMNGLEATKQIRGLSRADAKQIPIIAMTANAYEEDVEKSLSAGMNAHLAKPIDPKLLYDELKKYM